MADNFYVTLPSNVKSYDYFPENTVSNYVTKLASRLTFTGEWEVGLVEMSYTLSWFNVSKKHKILLLYWQHGKAIKIDKNVYVPKGRYDTIEEFVLQINSQFDLFFTGDFVLGIDDNRPRLFYNSRNRTITLEHGVKSNKLVFVKFTQEICQMLGFDYSKMISYYGQQMLAYGQIESKENPTGLVEFVHKPPKPDMKKYKPQYPYDLSGGYHSLFVYCDIVKPSYVGDSYTQLLRLVQIPGNHKYGEQILFAVSNIYYLPLLTKDFETIEIDIKDDNGQQVPFEFGRSIIVLHFRKIAKNNTNELKRPRIEY